MGCGNSQTQLQAKAILAGVYEPTEIKPERINLFQHPHSQYYSFRVFDYLTISDLARVSQVCK